MHVPSGAETSLNLDLAGQVKHLLASPPAEHVAHELWQATRNILSHIKHENLRTMLLCICN